MNASEAARRAAARFRDLPIRRKLLFALIVPLAFVSVASLLALQISFGIYDSELGEASARALSASLSGIEASLRRVEEFGYGIAYDAETQAMLRQMKVSRWDYPSIKQLATFREEVLLQSLTEEYLVAIVFRDSEGRDIPVDSSTFSILEEATVSSAVDAAAEGRGSHVWLDALSRQGYIVSARQVLDTGRNLLDPLGTLVFAVDMRKIVDRYLASSAYGAERVFLVSDSGILYSRGELPPGLVHQVRSLGESGYRVVKMGGQRFFAVSIRSSINGWRYVSLLPYERVFSRSSFLRTILLVFFGFILLVAVFGSIRLARSITRPLESLARQMGGAERELFAKGGDRVGFAVEERRDEVGALQVGFVAMMERIDRLIEESVSKQLLVREAEYKALQAQINPHFLYNTLGSINWLARKNRQDEISSMVEALASLFRASISGSGLDGSIDDELKLLESYIHIQRVRYSDRIDYRAQVGERFLDYRIPRLSLQAIVENSITHAVESSSSVTHIRLVAEEEGDRLLLSVSDDGPGIAPEAIEGLLSPAARGVGFKNIDERMRLMYGEAFGLRIRSAVGEGTIVCLSIPLDGKKR
jgi:Predicted signal transduction protein with a C-terminal ATPase domain